jgi:hypothetical protein
MNDDHLAELARAAFPLDPARGLEALRRAVFTAPRNGDVPSDVSLVREARRAMADEDRVEAQRAHFNRAKEERRFPEGGYVGGGA